MPPSIIIKKSAIFLLPVFFIFSSIIPSVRAQEPPGSEPGAQTERFQTEAEKEKARLEKKELKKPQIEIEEEKEKPAAGPAFVLKEVNVTGSSVFKPEDFRSAYEHYIDKEVTFEDLQAIVEKIKEKYKKKGYLTTVVYIPEQDIVDGKVEIRISEGKAGDTKVEGNKWFSTNLLEKSIHIKKNELLNIFTLQRDLIRLNQNPDLQVKTVISAGKEPGTSDITLKVKERFPYHIGVKFDNQGTRLTGKERISFSLRSTNMAGLGDSLFLNGLITSLTSGAFASYQLPVDTYGTKLGIDLAYFGMKIGKEYKGNDITGKSLICTPKILKEFYLSEDFQLTGDVGIEMKSIKKWAAGRETADDQLRTPYAGAELTKVDALFGGGQTTFSPKASFGTSSFLGASSRNHPSANRPGTGGFFFKYEHNLNRIQKMPILDSYLSIRSQFQSASHTLSSSEQLQLGGANSVRGYPEGDYLADIGGTLNVDWVFPMFFLPKELKLPRSQTPLRQQVEFVIFADLGGGKLKKVGSDEKSSKFLAGVGGGIRFHVARNLFIKLDWAEAVGDRPAGGGGPSSFNVAVQFEI